MDRLEGMAAFVKSSEAGSFAAAAAALGISPQRAAKHVTFLEDRIGAQLLNRTTRRQSLTEVGRTYCERCKSVLAEAEAADSLAQEIRSVPRGTLRVNAPVTFGAHSLVPMAARYLRRHPEVEIDLVLSDRYVDLVEEGYEAAFRIGPLASSGLMARPLCSFTLIACASPGYLRERGTPATPSDLQDHECVGHAHWSEASTTEWRFVKDGQVADARFRNHLRVNDAKGLLSAALEGFGIVRVNEGRARDALASGRLVRVLPDHDLPSRPMHLLYVADRRQTPKLRSFIDAAIEEFGTPGQRNRRPATSL